MTDKEILGVFLKRYSACNLALEYVQSIADLKTEWENAFKKGAPLSSLGYTSWLLTKLFGGPHERYCVDCNDAISSTQMLKEYSYKRIIEAIRGNLSADPIEE
jgi:hypothetical protein